MDRRTTIALALCLIIFALFTVLQAKYAPRPKTPPPVAGAPNASGTPKTATPAPPPAGTTSVGAATPAPALVRAEALLGRVGRVALRRASGRAPEARHRGAAGESRGAGRQPVVRVRPGLRPG